MGTVPSPPAEHDLFPSLVLPDHLGEPFDTGVFSQRRNLVLSFVRKPAAAAAMLRGLGAAARELDEYEANVIVIAARNEQEAGQLKLELDIPFPVLADPEGSVVGSFCPGDVSVYVTDRFREIFLVLHGPESVPDAGQVLQRLRFIEHQCPE